MVNWLHRHRRSSLGPSGPQARHIALASVVVAAIGIGSMGCGGTNNVASCSGGVHGVPCNPQTPDELAQAALNNGDYTGGITQYTALVTADPTNYPRYLLLASGYAARAGFNLLNLAEQQFAGGGTLLSLFSTLIPGPAAVGPTAFAAAIADMSRAVVTLKSIPAALVANPAASSLAPSAILQLTIYQSAYAIMLIEQIAISATTGQFDPNQLATMSESQAEAVVQSLLAAGQVPGVTTNAAVQSEVTAAVAAIYAEPGADTKAKLNAYITAQQNK